MKKTTQHTVLVIDDNRANLKLLHELLSKHGYLVRVADSPKQGLESACTTPPDLILLDIRMPEMDGYELCEALKKAPQTEAIPVIFISASSGALNKVKAFDVGGVDYINKPFDAAEVIVRIENHLQLSTLQKQTQNSLVTSQHMLEAVMNNSPAVIYMKDLDGRYLMVNKAFIHQIDIGNQDVIGKNDFEIFTKDTAELFTQHDHDVISSSQPKEFEETLDMEGSPRTYLSSKFPLTDSNGVNFAICGISTDITMRKRAEERLEHLATYDTLTELPNRSLFTELLTRTMALSFRDSTQHAILFIDLDNFKNVNDSLGHSVGDILLKEVAKRLKDCTREGDTVSRMGGDEFVLLLHQIKHPTEAVEVSEKIIQALSPACEIDGHTVFITPSIGIVISPDSGRDAQKLLRNADTAMYYAKRKGRNTYQFFNEEMNQRVLQRMEIEKELRIALQEDNINPFYQPKVDACTGEIIGVEALARWHHHKHGEISPEKFIPIAEKTDLIISLDRYILKTAIKQFGALINQGVFKGTLSINLAAHHFYRNHLKVYIDELLQKYSFPEQQLVLELTEGTVMKDADMAIKLMHELYDSGIQFSIDDFGTGYSSLSYLKQFPLNSLKIDIGFIRDLNTSDTDKNLIELIINLAHSLKLECVAEGVETIEQVKTLQDMKCDTLQGYLFSQAVDFEAISSLLKNNKTYSDYLKQF